GFVQSWLKVVDLVPGAPGGPPAVEPEQIAGGGPTKPLFRSINLNRDYTVPSLTAVPPAQAIAQATDVALLEDAQHNVVRIVLAPFGSDKVAVLTPDANAPSGYGVRQVPIPMVNTTAGYSAVGPRGLALDPSGVDPAAPLQRGLVW